ncbi:MAG TPA: M20/M25/M40 family metallo-hydrolase, partial [Gemmatimonadaceae bacterium]
EAQSDGNGGDEAAYMGPGVSLDLARHRAASLSEVRYALELDVTHPDTARGAVTVGVNRAGGGDLILDFRGIALDSAVINGTVAPIVRGDAIAMPVPDTTPQRGRRRNQRNPQPPPAIPVAFNGAHIRVPAVLLRDGANSLRLKFRTPIAPAGASIIKFVDSGDGSTYLYTLLVPADANLLFPSFDQPDLKARVSLALRTPAGWSAVANGSLVDSIADSGAVVHRFAETEPLSTYLIAFAAGPWVAIKSPEGTRPVTLFVRRSRADEVDADTLIAMQQRALDWLEQYFARPFPFAKYDLVLAPAFPFGGMEHPGAVFYNEESFIFRERPTLNQRLGREATTYHEVAHQWFGDLVTMRWFDDLWLKEGFATYMAAKMQDALSPDANAWKTFYLRNKPSAYAVDATIGTTPVWQELANLDQAKSNYGAIVYNKAPSVLKQLNYLVGDSAFQLGVRDFLARHAYNNATWRDLLSSIGSASGRSLEDWGAQYILRPGMPVLEQQPLPPDSACAGCMGGVRLVQRPAQPLAGKGVWPMRVEVLFGNEQGQFTRVDADIESETTLVRLPAASPPARFVFANASDYGYGLVMLDTASASWLQRHIGTIEDAFLRAMLWGALWDLVREAQLPPQRFINLALRELPRETDEQIVAGTLGRMSRAFSAYLNDAQRAAIRPAVELALWKGVGDTTRPYGIRKSHLDTYIALAGTPAAIARLDSLLDVDSIAGEPLRSPTRWEIVSTLIERGAPTADERLAKEMARDSTTEGKRRAFAARAARADASAKADYFARYFADSTLNEEWATASLGNFNSPSQSALTLPYLVPALDSLEWIQKNRRIFYLGRWLDAFLGGQTSAEALAAVDTFLAHNPDLPLDLERKVLQSADELRRTVRIRQANGASRQISAPLPPGADSVRAAIRAYREANNGAILRELVELLKIPNVARDSANIRRNAAMLVSMLERRRVAAKILESPGSPPAVFGELRVPGATRTVMFYAHYDGQPVDTASWVTAPWEPVLRDGPLDAGGNVVPIPTTDKADLGDEWRLYARSASDDKSPIVAMLAALDALRAARINPSVNIKFFFEGGEEAGSPRLGEMLSTHAETLKADVWLFCDGPVHQSREMQVVFGVRGVIGADLTIYGPDRPLHSGHYGNWAPNPGALLVSLLASMRDADGNILIEGFDSDVRPMTDTERVAIAAVPSMDDALRQELALGATEANNAPLLERIMLPALNIQGMQMGGVGPNATNTIHPQAHAALGFRLVPDQTTERVKELVEAHIRAQGYHLVHDEPSDSVRQAHPRVARVVWGDGYPGLRTDMASPVSQAVLRTVQGATGRPVLAVPMLGGSLPLATFEQTLKAPLIIVPIVNHDNNQHASNENVRLKNLWDGMEVLGSLMARLGREWR